MHMKTDLLNSVGDIRPGEGKVLRSFGETAKIRGIKNWCTISRKLRICINRSGAQLTVSHASMVENLKHVLSLGKKEARTNAMYAHAQKVMKSTKILHREFLSKRINDPRKQRSGRGREHDVIHIKKQVDSISTTVVDE